MITRVSYPILVTFSEYRLLTLFLCRTLVRGRKLQHVGVRDAGVAPYVRGLGRDS